MSYIDYHNYRLSIWFSRFETYHCDTLYMPMTMNGQSTISCDRLTDEIAPKFLGRETIKRIAAHVADIDPDDVDVHIHKTVLNKSCTFTFTAIISGLFFRWRMVGPEDRYVGVQETTFKEKCLAVAKEYVKDDLSKYS